MLQVIPQAETHTTASSKAYMPPLEGPAQPLKRLADPWAAPTRGQGSGRSSASHTVEQLPLYRTALIQDTPGVK
jgi:hypothetical protein